MRVEVPSRARRELTIRVNGAERRLLEAAAAKQPQHLTTYIREAALIAARRALSTNGRERQSLEAAAR